MNQGKTKAAETLRRLLYEKEASKEARKTLLPQNIASMCIHGEHTESELKWNVMMSDLHDKGLVSKLRNCIAVCDMSHSMKGMLMEVCTALSVLISEISGEPWDHKVITFNENPKIHTVPGKTLREKLKFLQGLQNDTDRCINFRAVFNCILDMAKKLQLPEEKIIKKKFVFTDKEFKDASKNPWLQDYRASCRNFMEARYGNVMPQVVFWNLQGSRALTTINGGVMILKGFSNNLLKLFLERGGVIHAKNEMASDLGGEAY
ncbi:hypothetical protein C2845_PM01G13420 [Panicum miliaceum]|uniref:DUF7788 domain-containing protein n=1 Tax=Panicum miliaceum TaxID=4540 RepID=A0A3L6TQQ4_PANMI|nr:hypothetical protein C2845_PM01G13420 [Panicum miliaceum]